MQEAKRKAAAAEAAGDLPAARGHQAHADLIRDKLLRGDYDHDDDNDDT
jgi:hypothetical protein